MRFRISRASSTLSMTVPSLTSISTQVGSIPLSVTTALSMLANPGRRNCSGETLIATVICIPWVRHT